MKRVLDKVAREAGNLDPYEAAFYDRDEAADWRDSDIGDLVLEYLSRPGFVGLTVHEVTLSSGLTLEDQLKDLGIPDDEAMDVVVRLEEAATDAAHQWAAQTTCDLGGTLARPDAAVACADEYGLGVFVFWVASSP